MTKTPDTQTVVTHAYNAMVEDGYDPLAIAATFMITAFTVYASQLTPQSYTEVVEKIFSTAGVFINKSNRTLH